VFVRVVLQFGEPFLCL